MEKRRAYRAMAILAGLSVMAVARADQGGEDLAAQARDPTASLTAFAIRYDWTASYHGASGKDSGAVVVQPIIPFKLGDQRHIARITASYVTHAPSFDDDIDQNPLPPNFIPEEDKKGFADTAVLDVLIFDADWGRWGVGPIVSLPTGKGDALGTGKWSVGPALVGITRSGKWQYGLLGTWLVDVAGDSDRDDVNFLTLQPFGSYDLGGGWSAGLSEVSYSYDFENDRWGAVPIGGRIEKLVSLGNLNARVFLDAEYNLNDSDISREWTFRLAFVPLL